MFIQWRVGLQRHIYDASCNRSRRHKVAPLTWQYSKLAFLSCFSMPERRRVHPSKVIIHRAGLECDPDDEPALLLILRHRRDDDDDGGGDRMFSRKCGRRPSNFDYTYLPKTSQRDKWCPAIKVAQIWWKFCAFKRTFYDLTRPTVRRRYGNDIHSFEWNILITSGRKCTARPSSCS